jgi:retinol-binding protein 3
MFYRPCLALVLGLAATWVQQTPRDPQARKEPAIPDTPAGHTFEAWLEAFNSGDRALMDAYYRKYDPSKSVENEKRFRDMTGGFDVQKVVKSERLHLEFLVKERRSDTQAIGKLDVNDGEPALVTGFWLRAIPPGTSVSDLDFKVDAVTRARVIDGAILNLNEFYVSPETAKKMGDAVRTPSEKRRIRFRERRRCFRENAHRQFSRSEP